MAEVIKQIKTKSNDSFSSPIFLGAEQRFVGALRGNTGVDNLEEQYIIGVDCITTEEWNGTSHKLTKEFRNSEQSTDYYKLVIEYNNEKNSGIENGILTVSEVENLLRTETLYYIKNNTEYKISEKTVSQTVSENKDKIITTETIKRF